MDKNTNIDTPPQSRSKPVIEPVNTFVNSNDSYSNTNKYPSFDMGGDNYSKAAPVETLKPIQPITPGQNINNTAPPPTIITSATPPATYTDGTIVSETVKINATEPYASLTNRSLANLIDGLIVGFVSILLNLPMYIIQFKAISAVYSEGGTADQLSGALGEVKNPLYTFLSLISVLFGFIYPIYFIGKNGASPGKKVMHIKVINKDTKEVPGYLKAFLRETVGKVASSVFLFLGYFWAIWDKEKQAWHDKIAGTIVINNK